MKHLEELNIISVCVCLSQGSLSFSFHDLGMQEHYGLGFEYKSSKCNPRSGIGTFVDNNYILPWTINILLLLL